jgi:hypothetical protein
MDIHAFSNLGGAGRKKTLNDDYLDQK